MMATKIREKKIILRYFVSFLCIQFQMLIDSILSPITMKYLAIIATFKTIHRKNYRKYRTLIGGDCLILKFVLRNNDWNSYN